MQNDIKLPDERELTILKFLEKTKEGVFAEISDIPDTYVRIYEIREECYEEDAYTYSYS